MSNNNLDLVQEFLRDLKLTKENLSSYGASSGISNSVSSSSSEGDHLRSALERIRSLEERFNVLASRIQLLENHWKREFSTGSEDKAKVLRLLIRSEGIINNLSLENHNLRTQMDSLKKAESPQLQSQHQPQHQPQPQHQSQTQQQPQQPQSQPQQSHRTDNIPRTATKSTMNTNIPISSSRLTWVDHHHHMEKPAPLLQQKSASGIAYQKGLPAHFVRSNSYTTNQTSTPHNIPPIKFFKTSSGQFQPILVNSTNRNNSSPLDPKQHQKKKSESTEEVESKTFSNQINSLPVNYPLGYDPMKRRFSVSSESFTPEQFRDVKFRVIPKPDKVKAKIRDTVRVNILFKSLGEEELSEVVDAMEEVEYPSNTEVIKQGDYIDQNNMYLVNKGELQVFYGQEQVAMLTAGSAFGEIALMYGCPRTATVKTISSCSLWVLDRHTFRRILMVESSRKRKLYESILAKVPLFKALLPYERSKIADALETVYFKDKDVIIQQGSTETDKFYIIESGDVVCMKKGQDEIEVESMKLSTGDYFGELALIKNGPRQATVKAIGDVKCLTISKEHFDQVMGPCEDILRRNMGSYKSYDELVASLNNPEHIQNDKSDFTYTFTSLPENPDEFIDYLLKNEESYIDILKQTDEYYNAMFHHTEELHASVEQINKIYTSTKDIFAIHKNFYKSLQQFISKRKDITDTTELVSIFSSFISSFPVYDQFVGGYIVALNCLSECKKQAEFDNFLKECDKLQCVTLESLLESILKRVPQIVALLHHLVLITDSHAEKNLLAVALKKAEAYRITLKNIKQAAAAYNT